MQRKTARLGFVLSPREKEILRHLAEREGVSLATVIRLLIRKAGRADGLWPAKEVVSQ